MAAVLYEFRINLNQGADRSNGPLVQTGLMIFLMVLDRSSYRTDWYGLLILMVLGVEFE